jgi:hypothetical protein
MMTLKKAILPGSGLLTRRKVSLVGEYIIGRGQMVTTATTIQGIVLFLKRPMTQETTAPPPTLPHVHPLDLVRGVLKLYVDALTEFSGQPIKYKQWVLAARAPLGQTVYGTLRENPPPPGDVIMETRNKELFHMLVTACMPGLGMHLLQVTYSVADDGHAAFNSIRNGMEWRGSHKPVNYPSLLDKTRRFETQHKHYRIRVCNTHKHYRIRVCKCLPDLLSETQSQEQSLHDRYKKTKIP